MVNIENKKCARYNLTNMSNSFIIIIFSFETINYFGKSTATAFFKN
jgi:hypothetical protein